MEQLIIPEKFGTFTKWELDIIAAATNLAKTDGDIGLEFIFDDLCDEKFARTAKKEIGI